MCASQSGGGGAAPFSGASVQNFDVGQTFGDGLQLAPVFTQTTYDTDTYLAGGSHFIVPKTGYYSALFGFLADSPFVGTWEVDFTIPGRLNPQVSGDAVASRVAAGQVSTEEHLTAGGLVTFTFRQVSGADQLVYPYARIHYLGS